MYKIFLLVIALCVILVNAEEWKNVKYTYETKTIEVPVDHFNKAINATFSLRYLYNNTYATNNSSAPIFFYTGNEGDIELFAQNSGFVWEAAAIFGATVVFAEHRYYGKSIPFGSAAFNSSEKMGYLSVEQALEDFVQVIVFLNPAQIRPVVAFGGSYGGMLSAWLRMKYPQVVTGALAASAPIWQFNGLAPCDIFPKIVTSIYTNTYSPNCSANIKQSWNLFQKLASTEDGRNKLNTKFKFCKPFTQEKDIKKFFDYLEDVYANLAMANYPYENDFLAHVPAYPVRQFCLYLKDLQNETTLLNAMYEALSVYTNFTGTAKCLELVEDASDFGGKAWGVQVCNQIVMPMCSFANETMYRDVPWDFVAYSNECYEKYKIRPQLNEILNRYWGRHLEFTSNIIFSNGLLDPWSGGGVLSTYNSQIHIIIIPEGAHHLDLRASNEKDPASVVQARQQETIIIREWIRNYLQDNKVY